MWEINEWTQSKPVKKTKLFAVVISPVGHMTPVSKPDLRFKKSKQASKALQHYYVHSSSGGKRSRCLDEGRECETETPVKQDSCWKWGL